MNGNPPTPDGARNRLSASSSPYLRQHANNPVHWFEWDDAALDEARRRDVPILLSVGYAACHWCHVMAHESFEDDATATQMNAEFVCVKVDREERPDIDAIYMSATVAMTGQGGWPMTCFLTPAGEPFYAGTYFPSAPRSGMPSFRQVMAAVTEAWTDRRAEIDAMADKVREHVEANAGALPPGTLPIDERLLAHAVTAVLDDEDRAAGGFGGAPKFPPSALLEGLIRHSEHTGDSVAIDAAVRTCAAMARGGIYDQIAGGFARYAVDKDWVIPHFEKMLYDNAQLLRAYAHLARRTSDPFMRRVTAEIVDFLDQDLRVGGGFASSLDADTAGVEGSTYVWTPSQLVEVLGEDDGRWAAELFVVTEAGTFEHGTSTLQLPSEPDDLDRFDSVRQRLRVARAARTQPARDDKVVTAWNAMAITALAEAGAGLGERQWIDHAVWCAEQIVATHVVDGAVRRSSLGGVVGVPSGGLDDHAALATALLTLFTVTGDQRWRTTGLTILDRAVDVFADPAEPGSWFDAAGEGLITRPRDPVDGATPSGASLMAEALQIAVPLADAGDAGRYAELLEHTLSRGAILLVKLPRSAGHWLAVAQARVAGPIQIAVAQVRDSDGRMTRRAREIAPGGAVIVAGQRDSQTLLQDRGPVDGHDAAYVCRGQVCGLPLTEPEALTENVIRGR
ncbi:thioredoxin domain-containing protein [Gordonia sp. ABSL49_1]|uniref:thioredoxin domain-containing protein n=1 Tax=Gordonia sp. ABSL49_1 TaxID=2920941 RepID=UPI001F10EA22|nr:thioredoxin domain-containing protein [Gordonia sp. ABSL49_1]MCH5642097.1 thioredoxin domain-containing protein [Gordonia sp. ABSL49_1]